MNKRIVELIENQNGHRGVLWTEEDKEEFAELIVEEIMQELFINGYEDAFDHLNEHFGVE